MLPFSNYYPCLIIEMVTYMFMQYIWLWNIYEKVAKGYLKKKKRDLLNSLWWGFGFENLNIVQSRVMRDKEKISHLTIKFHIYINSLQYT